MNCCLCGEPIDQSYFVSEYGDVFEETNEIAHQTCHEELEQELDEEWPGFNSDVEKYGDLFDE